MRHTWPIGLHWLSTLLEPKLSSAWVQKLGLAWLVPASLTPLSSILTARGRTAFLAVPGTSKDSSHSFKTFLLAGLCARRASPPDVPRFSFHSVLLQISPPQRARLPLL